MSESRVIDLEQFKRRLRKVAGFTNGQSLNQLIVFLILFESYLPLSNYDRRKSRLGLEYQAALSALDEDGVDLERRRAIINERYSMVEEFGGIESYLQALELVKEGREDEAAGK